MLLKVALTKLIFRSRWCSTFRHLQKRNFSKGKEFKFFTKKRTKQVKELVFLTSIAIVAGHFVVGPFCISLVHYYRLKSLPDSYACVYFFHFADCKVKGGPEFFSEVTKQISESKNFASSETIDEYLQKTEPRSYMILDFNQGFSQLITVADKDAMAAPLESFGSPLFVIGYTPKITKKDQFKLMCRVHMYNVLANWKIPLLWYDDFETMVAKEFIEYLSPYGFQYGSSLDYLERWQKQHPDGEENQEISPYGAPLEIPH